MYDRILTERTEQGDKGRAAWQGKKHECRQWEGEMERRDNKQCSVQVQIQLTFHSTAAA